MHDLKFAIRQLLKAPGFTLVAILTLALGIGANTSMFSIVNAVLLRSLPYRDPAGLVRIRFNNPGLGLRDVAYSYLELEDLKKSGVFEEVSADWPVSANLTGVDHPERLEMLAVSPNYFSMLGATPQLGRLLGAQDTAAGFAEAVVISDSLWRRAYGTNPSVLGRKLRIDNDPYMIVGVLPPDFRHPGRTVARDTEVFATAGFSADPFQPTRNSRGIPGAIGRLKAGLRLAEAQARLDGLADQLRRAYPNDYPPEAKWSIAIQPLQQSLVGEVRPMLLVLMGAVILIVLITSVNLANLLLARASGRQREMAIRQALGAGRSRLMRQLLTEAALLAVLGGGAGVLLASGTLHFVLQLVPASIPRLGEVAVDGTVLAFALATSLLTGLVFGLAPALQATKVDLMSPIREGSMGSSNNATTSRLRSALIISEVALAVVLLIGAGLLLRTFWRLTQQNLGFEASHVVAASIWLPVPNDPKADMYGGIARQLPFTRDVLARARAIPGVEEVGLTSSLPTGGGPVPSVALAVEDQPAPPNQDLRAEMIRVSPEYFQVMHSALVRGRWFVESDEAGKQEVAIVDETTARRYWPNQDPIGRRLRLGQQTRLPWITVVGILRDIKHNGLDQDGVPHIYRPIFQQSGRVLHVVLRTSRPVAAIESELKRAVQAVDPGLPVYGIRTMTEVVDLSLAPRRFSAELIAGFAALALLLASMGIYGLLSYMVGQRSREMSIRLALGAQPADIHRLVLGKASALAGAGIALGLIGAALAAPATAALLYGIAPHDPVIFVAVPALLAVVALAACLLPARRAAKVDLTIALRAE